MSKSTASLSSEFAKPDEVRRLVLEYLCNNCYADTARAFARDSTPREVDKDGDEVLLEEGSGYGLDSASLRFVRIRKEIQARILAGHIPESIELLNRHFPDVLSPKFAGSFCDPYHLRLNLQIQYFIELSRTLPLPWPQGFGIGDTSTLIWKSNDNEEDMGRNRRLISLMNELWSLVYSLPGRNKDRELYIKELKDVGGLLAYPIPEKDRELRKFLDRPRREAVADQINEAILYRMDKTVPSIVELIVRQTTATFATLHGFNRTLPAMEQRLAVLMNLLAPPSSSSPLSSLHKFMSAIPDTKYQITDRDGEKDEKVPIFQLSKLLGTEL